MSPLKNFLNRIVPISRTQDYGQTYLEELEIQAKIMIPIAVVISLFSWIPYIFVDIDIIGEDLAIILLRSGLSIVSIVVICVYRLSDFKYRALVCGAILIAYLEVVTGVITALAGFRPEYLGGYIFVLMMVPIIPFPLPLLVGIPACSILIFIFCLFTMESDLRNPVLRYSLQDLFSALFVSVMFSLILENIRKRSWKKSRKIEKLILNVLPPSIARELQDHGFVAPKKIESSTVVFTDFAGFTDISEKLNPEDLIEELHQIFRGFDSIVVYFNLEKLKTIGDSYMYAGGVPNYKKSHAVDAVLAALAMQFYVEERNAILQESENPYAWRMRLGINTGSVMAGVVGEQKYVYDIFGSTVNLASRLESMGTINTINISESTAKMTSDYFKLEYRGEIHAKGLGLVKMYFVRGFLDKWASSETCFKPNDNFLDYYQERFSSDISAFYNLANCGSLLKSS